ncbi:MAG: hypothetical protein R2733_02015 [Acidimicrobiales bacterium]
MRNRPDSGDAAFCPSCDGPRELWFTTCPTCDFPFQIGPGAILAGQVAAPLAASGAAHDEWIDIPIPADQPVKTALMRAFLADQGFAYEESRRFVSIRVSDAAAIESAITIWAYHHDLPEDHRHLDTLMSTLKEIGDATIAAIHAATMASTGSRPERGSRRDSDRDTDRDGGGELDLR